MVVESIAVVLRYSSPAIGFVGSVVLLSSLPARLLKCELGSMFAIYTSLMGRISRVSSANMDLPSSCEDLYSIVYIAENHSIPLKAVTRYRSIVVQAIGKMLLGRVSGSVTFRSVEASPVTESV